MTVSVENTVVPVKTVQSDIWETSVTGALILERQMFQCFEYHKQLTPPRTGLAADIPQTTKATCMANIRDNSNYCD